MMMGHEVIVMDNFFTGNKRNVRHWLGHPNFELVRHDVVDPVSCFIVSDWTRFN
jgi:UDP-glucuronate decarboxylase